MLSGGIERMTDTTRKFIRRDRWQHHRSDVHSDSISYPTGHDTHSLENLAVCGQIPIPNHLEWFLFGIISGDPDNKNQAQGVTPSSSRSIRILYTP